MINTHHRASEVWEALMNEHGLDSEVECAKCEAIIQAALEEARLAGRAELQAEFDAELLAVRKVPTPFNNPDLA